MPRGIPNSKPQFQDAAEVAQRPGLDVPVDKPLDGVTRNDLVIETATPDMMGDYARQLAFMEEPVDVIVHESTDRDALPIIDVYCNGVPQRFMRGQVQTVKRKFVEVLASARQTSVSTSIKQEDNQVYNRISKHSALRYPFSVANDPSGARGALWLKQLLQAA